MPRVLLLFDFDNSVGVKEQAATKNIKKNKKKKTPPQHSRRLYAALRTSTRLAVGGYVDRGSEALLYVGSSLGL
jgi:hypothetical protein